MCVGPNADQLDDNSLEQIGARKFKIDLDAGGSPKEECKNFDVALLDRVLSKKIDIPRYLEKVKEFLRDDGFAIVIEPTKDFEIALTVNALLGER